MNKVILLTSFLFLFGGLTAQNKTSYEITHSEEIQGYFAPYIYDYCEKEGLNTDSIFEITLKHKLNTKDSISTFPLILSSTQHITGMWTYYLSDSSLVYELENIDDSLYICLYNVLSPYEIIETENCSWQVVFFDKKYSIIDEKSFSIPGNYYTAMWDMIQTNLIIEDNKAIFEISYLHTGSGGSREQKFRIFFYVTNGISEIKVVEQTD